MLFLQRPYPRKNQWRAHEVKNLILVLMADEAILGCDSIFVNGDLHFSQTDWKLITSCSNYD